MLYDKILSLCCVSIVVFAVFTGIIYASSSCSAENHMLPILMEVPELQKLSFLIESLTTDGKNRFDKPNLKMLIYYYAMELILLAFE